MVSVSAFLDESELVEEIQTGSLVPLILSQPSSEDRDGAQASPKFLLGTALRSKRIAFVDVQIYVLCVYGPPGLLCGAGSDEMTATDLAGSLLASREEKTFCLTLLRNVSGWQLSAGLADSLQNNAGVPKEECAELAKHLPNQCPKGGDIQFTVRPVEGEMIISSSLLESEGIALRLPETVRGIHEVYFGPKSVVTGLVDSLHRQRCILMERGLDSRGVAEDADERLRRDSGMETESVMQALTQIEENGGDDSWPGAVVVVKDTDGTSWMPAGGFPKLTSMKELNEQQLEGTFYKHHSSPVRGVLMPRWTLRHYEVKGSLLRYRRKEHGKLAGELSLDGAWVRVERLKVSRLGECYIFSIIVRGQVACELSATDKDVAIKWVHALSAICAYMRTKGSVEEVTSQTRALPCTACAQVQTSPLPPQVVALMHGRPLSVPDALAELVRSIRHAPEASRGFVLGCFFLLLLRFLRRRH